MCKNVGQNSRAIHREIESELIYVPEASACRQTVSLQPADRSINNVATQRLEHWRQQPSTVRVAECGSVCTSISTICSCLYVHCQQKALYVAPPVAICLGHLADETSYTMSAQVKPKETAYQPFQALGKGTKRGCSVAVVVYTSRFATPVASHVFTKIATARFFSSKRGAMLTAPLSNTSLYCYVQLYALFFFFSQPELLDKSSSTFLALSAASVVPFNTVLLEKYHFRHPRVVKQIATPTGLIKRTVSRNKGGALFNGLIDCSRFKNNSYFNLR